MPQNQTPAMEDEGSEVGLSLIKQLASCEKRRRDKALSLLLDSWLPAQTLISEDLMRKLWKGLFYCVWHADKFAAQSHLAERLASLLPALDFPLSLHYLSVFLVTMRREWTGIDVLRLDKFYLLIRRFLHHFFVLLKNGSWDLDLSRRFVTGLAETTFFAKDMLLGHGVSYHVATIFVEELTPFLPLRLEVLQVLFEPFIALMGESTDKILLAKVRSNVFDVLVKNGRELLAIRSLGEDVDSGNDIVVLGSIALLMGFSAKLFDLGSAQKCLQGNRKIIFGLHEEFAKIEKDFASSGVEVSIPENVERDDEEVPELIPIVTSEPDVVEAPSLKKCKEKKSKSATNGEEQSKKDKKKKKKKKMKNDSNHEEVNVTGEDLLDEDMVPLDESAMSNLQMQFEKIAAEAGMEGNAVANSCDATVSKKRKRAKASNGKSQTAVPTGEEDTNGEITAKSGEKSAKKVKFSMRNNLVWKAQTPLPPQSLRLPPSATPRGSALKKGVPAGPIREVSSQSKKAKLRNVSVKKARKSVKRLKKVKSIPQ